jgi:hypothetical protein
MVISILHKYKNDFWLKKIFGNLSKHKVPSPITPTSSQEKTFPPPANKLKFQTAIKIQGDSCYLFKKAYIHCP